MRKCTYSIAVPSGHNPNELCLYHTLRDHLVRIDQSGDERFDTLLEKVREGLSLSDLEQGALASLKSLEFVVPDNCDERELINRWYEEKIQSTSSGSFVATILTSMSCNLRCKYCYEQENLSNDQFMSSEMASRVSNWLIWKIAEQDVKRMNVVFFGGEPLLNCNAIESIGATLEESCKAFGIEWKAGVITNGTLLTAEVAEILSRAGISWAKVTLDGDEAAHDRLRPFANGHGTYRRIMDNLASAARYLKIAIGGNFDSSNVHTIPALLDQLAVAPWKDSLISVGFKPIAPFGGHAAGAERTACSLSSFTNEQINQIVEIREEVKRRGLPVMSDPSVGPCDFYRPNVVTIGVDGSLYPCGAFVGMPELVMGNVTSSELTPVGEKIANIRAWEEGCYKCAYLPVCAGGCRVPAYFQKGDLAATVCDKRFYDRMIPCLVAECDEEHRRGEVQSSLFI
jgi:uncharacterized protein